MRTWTKRDPVKNYFPLPNEIYHLGLSHGAIAVYGYLLRIEDRRTYQCHPSYATIGKAVGMSRNTVRKYVQELEERGLIRTERTSIITRDGRKQNGSLLYTILPIQFSRSASSGSGFAHTSAQYVLCTSPSRNIEFILSRAFDVFASTVIPLTGLSRRCGRPMKTCPGLESRIAMKALYFSLRGSSPVLSP